MKMGVKMYEMLFKNLKWLFENTNQTASLRFHMQNTKLQRDLKDQIFWNPFILLKMKIFY